MIHGSQMVKHMFHTKFCSIHFTLYGLFMQCTMYFISLRQNSLPCLEKKRKKKKVKIYPQAYNWQFAAKKKLSVLTLRLQPVNGPSLCSCSLCAQFDKKKSPIKLLPCSSKGHKDFKRKPAFTQQRGYEEKWIPVSRLPASPSAARAVFRGFLGRYNDLEIKPCVWVTLAAVLPAHRPPPFFLFEQTKVFIFLS